MDKEQQNRSSGKSHRRLIRRTLSAICRGIRFFNGRKILPEHPRCVLVIASGYIGDTFWAIQTDKYLHTRWPDAQIHWTGRSFFRDLAFGRIPEECQHTVLIPSDRTRDPVSLFALRREALALRKTLRPDIVIDLMGNRYSAFFAFFLRGFTIGPDLAEETKDLYDGLGPIADLPPEHLALRPLRIALWPEILPQTERVPVPPVPRFSREEILSRLNIHDPGKIVLFLPGAGWAAKQWSVENFRTLAELLTERGYSVLIAGTRNEYKTLCLPAAKGLSGVRACCLPLEELFSLLPHLGGCIGSDSGITHIAAAADLPTVTLFCPTNPVFSRPLGKYGTYLQAPCPNKFCGQYCSCPPKTFCSEPCRMNLPPQQVLEAFESVSDARKKDLN